MIEIISIHIAKTGGRSFYEILWNEYGEALDRRTRRVDYFPGKDYEQKLADRIPASIRVIHGHLHYKHVKEIHQRDNSRVIAWLREPVDRVISNYYYMISRVNEVGEQHSHYRKKDHTLLEYAYDSVPNKMSKCLSGIDLEELFFFGFQESFSEDVNTLARMLAWEKEIPAVHINIGKAENLNEQAATKWDDIDAGIREEIAYINSEDVLLYKKATNLKHTL